MWVSGPWRDTEAHASPRNIHPQKSPRRGQFGGGFCVCPGSTPTRRSANASASLDCRTEASKLPSDSVMSG